MKKIILLIIVNIFLSCNAQEYPLRTYGIEFPKDSYLKDTTNELSQYEGVWKATWSNKTIFITLKKIKYYKDFLDSRAYYADILIGKFKVSDNNGNILFDNTNIIDDKAKIKGTNFGKSDNKYSLFYIDRDLCGITGDIIINFIDSAKTKLQWIYSKDTNWIDTDCFYYDKPASERPDPLPYNIIFTKQ
ncbi:DUF6705 family protein [Epilithonimonas zeae]|uniref:DUF6705 domain-containing protein n=1 Tax=Epilithonimonas zeae TaxID=1416779 RepID=A0A1N6DTX2_9FLAO|nr:DUF6705 family protein [Epilithonimonas zeae]SIN74258.1 hypothetical protein SAMN05444409_0050 [Epilithonimonas zeae]